jgi:hypothetical protein
MSDQAGGPSPEIQPTEVLAGSIERVTFHSAESGFCVLRIKARGHRELVTVVGHAAEISAGEWVTVSGQWVNSREHGQQFKASFLRASAPTTAEGIEKVFGLGDDPWHRARLRQQAGGGLWGRGVRADRAGP